MSITELAIKRPTLVVVFFTVLTVLGVICYQRLNYNLFPKFDTPVITILTTYPGASSSEVETSVTKVIEDAISSLEKIDNIASTSQENISIVTVTLTTNADADKGLQDAQRKINAILALLPDEIDAPSLSKFAVDDLPIMRMGATATLSPTQFYQLLDDRIKPQLSKIEGMGQITLVGGQEREIKVYVDPTKLKAFGVSVSQVTSAINRANQDVPTGNVEADRDQYTLRLAGKYTSLRQLGEQTITQKPDGSAVRIRDVADVADATVKTATVNRINGVSSVGILVQKQTDANTVQVARSVRDELAQLEKAYATAGLHFTIASDSSVYTLASADAVVDDLINAIGLVALVMLVFLHSLRNALIVMIAIPCSIVSVFIVMYLFNFSLNLMTLMGLSLVVGILVDDSIVVIENITRHLEMGKPPRQAALDGRNEIGFTAISITFVDVVIYLPLALVTGLIGNILREFAIVILASTLMSLVVSFTVTPLLASRFSRLASPTSTNLLDRFGRWFERGFDRVKDSYAGLLRWSLSHKIITAGLAVVLLLASLQLVTQGFIGSEFIPASDQGDFIISLETDQRSTVRQTNQVARQVEALLRTKPEVANVFTSVGTATAQGLGIAQANIAELTVKLVDKGQRTIGVNDFANAIKLEIQALPGVSVSSAPVGMLGTAQFADIQLIVKGPDLATVQRVADQVQRLAKGVPGTSDVKLSVNDGKPELQLSVDRDKAASLGLAVADVGSTLRTAYTGNDDAKYRDGTDDYKIRVVFDDLDRASVTDVAHLTVPNTRGQLIELGQFTQIQQTTGATKLQRKDRIAAITVQSGVVGRPLGTVGDEIRAKVSGLRLPDGVSIEYAGQLKNQADAFGSLGRAILISILFVYLIMVALYNSYIEPFVVLFSIPLAVIGALLALALTMQSLSIFSILGLIMLIGLVAKNAILLVNFANQAKEAGRSSVDALVEAGRERLRPILMTTLAMVIGMLPIALASGAAAESKNGLAWVLVGGLTSSMFLTLVVVPVVFLAVDNLLAWASQLGKPKPATEPVPS